MIATKTQPMGFDLIPWAARFLVAAMLAFLMVSLPASAQSDERIKDYHTEIVVNPDGTVDITEVIAVTVLGRQIQRGIYRDIPQLYERRDGMIVSLNLQVADVLRNGLREPYSTSETGRYKRIRIGSSSTMLPYGLQTYQIRYRVENSIGFFDAYDEIYWNATGNEWGFPIDHASVRVVLPPEAKISQFAAYTGKEGDDGDAYAQQSRTDNTLALETTSMLNPGEGITVAVGWQKGVVASPSSAERAATLFRDNLPTMVLAIGALVLVGWLVFAWLRVGIDPKGGAIFPRFRPSSDLSPALASYISGMGSFKAGREASFMGALINLAIKGVVSIDETGDKLAVTREQDPSDKSLDKLPAGEKALARNLLGYKDRAVFADMKYEEMSTVMSAFAKAIEKETNQVYFRRNIGYMLTGFLITLASVLIYVILSSVMVPPFIFPIVEMIAAGLCFVVLMIITGIVQNMRGRPSGFAFKGAFFAVFIGMFFTVFSAVFFQIDRSFSLGFTFLRFQPIILMTIMLMALAYFSDWMRAPTKLGRQVMDEVEGLKLFMTVTVAQQLDEIDMKDMPDLTPKLYEDLLPYAVALGVDKAWSEVFEDKVFSQLPKERAYRPTWYHGAHFNPSRPAAALAGMTSALGTDLSSAMTPPASSSSGSGGGGFSGGGGGGGGGGGW